MTKPDDIPQDVWDKACDTAWHASWVTDMNADDEQQLYEAIARALLDARNAAQRRTNMREWQLIETAPRDGRAIILAWAIDADGERIEWEKQPTTAGVFVQVASWNEVEDWWWVYIDTPSDTPLHFVPTHWMPLPSEPGSR